MMQVLAGKTATLTELINDKIDLPNIVNINKEQAISIGEGSKLKYLQRYQSDVPGLIDQHYNLFVEQVFNTSYKLVGIACDGKIELLDNKKYTLEYDENEHPILNGVDLYETIEEFHSSVSA